MACFHPRTVYYPPEGGRPHFRNDFTGAWNQMEWTVGQISCGKCQGCLESRARAWSIRIAHEAQLHAQKSFVTLTYDDRHLPFDRSVSKRHLQLFMKRVRNEFGAGLRFFGVGEYGSQTLRAHYHLCLFGLDFTGDRVAAGKSHTGFVLYRSDALERIWGQGRTTVQDLTVETAAYCARYSMKKLGSAARSVVLLDGRTVRLAPEFLLMSRKPGLGRVWFERFSSDVYGNLDEACVVLRGGAKVPPPPYYDNLLRERSEEAYQRIKALRRELIWRKPLENVVPRIAVREEVHAAKQNLSKRDGI